jgi:hypothetical protein
VFETIGKSSWLSQHLALTDDAAHLPASMEAALLEWIFRKPRGRTATENRNTVYRHENLVLWNKMARYDRSQHTALAKRFDPESPAEAPTMRETFSRTRQATVLRIY